MADGRDVDLGEFGEFKISISAKAVDTLEEVTAETIRRPRVIYRMGKEWRNLLEETPKVLGLFGHERLQVKKVNRAGKSLK